MADRYWVGATTAAWNVITSWAATSGGAPGASVPTTTDNAIFDSATTYTVTCTGNLSLINFTVSAGTVTFTSTGTLTISGNFSLSTGTVWNATGLISFTGTAARTITTSATSIAASITFAGVGGTFQLQDALTLGATRTLTLTNGTLDLNGKTLTTGFFSSSNANTRTLAFGAGNIICNAAGGTLWTTATATNLTVTGTPVVNISYSGSNATTVSPGALSQANSISFNFTAGTYTLTFLGTTSDTAKDVNFTGFAGTLAARTGSSLNTIYGDLTFSTGMAFGAYAGAGTLVLGATSGTKIITCNGKTLDFPIQINAIGGTYQLADAFSSRNLYIFNGSFDGNGKIVFVVNGSIDVGDISYTTTTIFISNINITSFVVNITTYYGNISFSGTNSTASSFIIAGGQITLLSSFSTTSSCRFDGGTLNLGSYTLSCLSFSSSNTTTRILNFGTGNIKCTGSGTVWDTTTITGLTVSGTPVVEIFNNSATATTVIPGALSEANSISFNFTTGTYILTLNGSNNFRNLNFTGFAGSLAQTAIKIYGNVTMSSGASSVSGAAWTLASTSATPRTITSNAVTINRPLIFDGVGGTWQLQDALTVNAARTLTHTNGTIDLNGKTLTAGAAYTTATGTKNLTFNGGTLVCPTAAATAFNNINPAGYTTTAGTGTGKISMTAATAKTFVGGGSTFNCTLSNDGAGALTISGANTFTNIANGVQPTSFVFPISTTQTVTNWNVSGTAGNLVTITSGTAGTAATLSKASGTVSSNYLSLKDSTATGGATWYAGANSTNVSGNLGWIFTSAPAAYSITANNGFYALTGRNVTITRGFLLSPQNGSYAFTGRSVIITRGFLLSPQNGLYSLTGQAVNITYTLTPPVTGPTQYFIEIRSFTESRRI
jgi:hypothetical protein